MNSGKVRDLGPDGDATRMVGSWRKASPLHVQNGYTKEGGEEPTDAAAARCRKGLNRYINLLKVSSGPGPGPPSRAESGTVLVRQCIALRFSTVAAASDFCFCGCLIDQTNARTVITKSGGKLHLASSAPSHLLEGEHWLGSPAA